MPVMVSSLVVCPSCSRHVLVSESVCPFCVRPVPVGLVPVPHGPRRKYVGKGATALALALAASSCGGTVESTVETQPDAAAEASADTASDVADTRADVMDSDVADEGGPVPIYK